MAIKSPIIHFVPHHFNWMVTNITTLHTSLKLITPCQCKIDPSINSPIRVNPYYFRSVVKLSACSISQLKTFFSIAIYTYKLNRIKLYSLQCQAINCLHWSVGMVIKAGLASRNFACVCAYVETHWHYILANPECFMHRDVPYMFKASGGFGDGWLACDLCVYTIESIAVCSYLNYS